MAISFNDPPVGGNPLTETQRDIIRTALELGIDLGIVDPTSTGFPGPILALGYNTESPPKIYMKVDTPDTAWVQIGAVDVTSLALRDLTNIIAGSILDDIELRDYSETVVTTAASGTGHTIDLETGNVHDLTLSDNCNLTFSNPPVSGKAGSFTLYLRQDATGGRVVTFPASVVWKDGTPPTLSTGINEYDVLTFSTIDGGTNWEGFPGGTNFS